jgi:hypothetical protein
MKKQKIEDIFSSMENFSSVPPPELWAQIEEKLEKPKKKKRAILWWSAAACFLLGLMLNSIFHLDSASGVKNINNNSLENNSVVLDSKKNNLEKNRTISTKDNTTTLKSDPNTIVESTNELADSSDDQNQETRITNKSSKNNNQNNALDPKANSISENQAVAEKTFISNDKNALNTDTKYQNLKDKKANSNQAVAEKSFVPAQENSFTTASKNQIANGKNRTVNQAVAEKSFVPTQGNLFNTDSKNQIANNKNRKTNQGLAEQKISFGKKDQFNSPKKQLSNSIFDEQLISKNNKSTAFNTTNPVSNGAQNAVIVNKTTQKSENTADEKFIASVQKDNSKFNNPVLSKKDSVQLAELQNLEKGIIVPENKEEKETKAVKKGEKWAVAVFAGIANSENYKNEKTLGNVNDSKQTSTYGVKTKYKINKKWAVASGFKINELGQSVANVSYMSARNNVFFTIGDNYAAQNLAAAPIATDSNYLLIPSSTKEAVSSSNNIQTGNLDQSLRYIEMPLEVSYSVFNKNKASINLNTGGFVGKLISNQVILDGTSLGQNVNANDYVYGSTLSSTLQYQVYKKTNVFVEPAVNYYINPLNSQSFNQFQWGLNFGLNVSF